MTDLIHNKTIKIALIVFFLLLFSLTPRLVTVNKMGRVWDEHGLLEKGYIVVELLKHGDFSNKFWYIDAADHPVFGFYFIGLGSYGDLIAYDKNATPVFSRNAHGAPLFHYDLTYGRLVSIIASTLTVILVFFFGKRFFSTFIGIISAMILSLIPHYFGYSQLVELESIIVLFFTAAVFTFVVYLETKQQKYFYLTAVLTGINLVIKQSNLIIFIFYLLAFFFYKKCNKKVAISYYSFLPLGIISIVSAFIFYPMPWFHLSDFLRINYETWLKDSGRIPELLFGIHMGAPFIYYIVAVFVTTPLLLLILSAVGIKISLENKKLWIYMILLMWFITPFSMSLFHTRQHMVRYIIEFYVPLSLLAAIGLERIITYFIKDVVRKYLFTFPLFLYLFFSLFLVSPYYLSYYNELVGGVGTVYKYNLFFVGWWGEGLGEGGRYIASHAKDNQRIGLATTPNNNVVYRKSTLHYEDFKPESTYDYVLVNSFHVSRIGFNENILQKEYTLVYKVSAGGADFVHVYKHK